MLIHAGAPFLLPRPALVTPDTSEPLPGGRPHLKEPAAFPGRKPPICSPRPTLWGLHNFSELEMKQSKLDHGHLILRYLLLSVEKQEKENYSSGPKSCV